MGFFRACLLLAVSLGSSGVLAAGRTHRQTLVSASTPAAAATSPAAASDTAAVFTPLTAHIESTEASLQTPEASTHSPKTAVGTVTVKKFFPIIESTQKQLDVPSATPVKTPSTPKSQPQKTPDNDTPTKSPAADPPSAQKTPDSSPASSPDPKPDSSSPDKTPDSTPNSSPDTPSQKSSPAAQEHIVLSNGVTLGVSSPSTSSSGKDKPSSDGDDPTSGSPSSDAPDAVHTLWVKGTPLYVGQGLPPAVVKGTTYAIGPTGGWLVNGKPVHTPAATAVGSHESKGAKWSKTAEGGNHHPKPTEKVKAPKSHEPVPGKKPAKGSLTWKGPGLTTETGLTGAEANGAAPAAAGVGTKLVGVGLGAIWILVALM